MTGPEPGSLHQPFGAAPSRHHRDILDAVDPVGHRRRHDAGARIEGPQLLAVGGAVGRQDAVGAALKHQVAGRGQNARRPPPPDRSRARPPFWSTGSHASSSPSRMRHRPELGVERAVVRILAPRLSRSGSYFHFGSGACRGLGARSWPADTPSPCRTERHRLPVVRAVGAGRNERRLGIREARRRSRSGVPISDRARWPR